MVFLYMYPTAFIYFIFFWFRQTQLFIIATDCFTVFFLFELNHKKSRLKGSF